MQPIRLTIEGSYCDCQIYRGWLYLWTFDARLIVVEWNKLIDSLWEDEIDKFAFNVCFQDGSYLYKDILKQLLTDPEIKHLIIQKIQKLNNFNLNISKNLLDRYTRCVQDAPSRTLPIDTEIYDSKLYYCTDDGFYKTNAHNTRNNPVSSRPMKLWDARLLSLKANRSHQIALSAGDDGLFELNRTRSLSPLLKHIEHGIVQISDRHSSVANYTYLSLYSTSYTGDSFMSYFSWIRDERTQTFIRERGEDFDNEAIFGSSNLEGDLSWGMHDKLYRVDKNKIEVVRFHNGSAERAPQEKFSKLAEISFSDFPARPVSASSSVFGSIIEYEDRLIVIQSDGEIFCINAPITRWRIYPRSINYQNHLHVLLDDCMHVYSFNHDWLQNQWDKQMGSEYVDIEFKSRRYE